VTGDPVISVRDLEKRYRVWTHAPPTNLKERVRVAGASLRARAHLGERDQFRQDVWALRGVSFDVHRGEVLGVIGPNGAGKSTLLTILSRITEPTAGRAEIRGRVSSLLEVGTGFHPELTGRDNVFLNGAILGMSRAETRRKFDEIVEFSGVRDFIDIPVKRYSSGMQVRLAFSVAAHLEPEVLLLDEVLAVGDAAFQAKCHARVEEIARSGRTVLFVSHDVGSVIRLCQNAIVLEQGRVSFQGPADKATEHYLLGAGAPGGGERRREGPVGPVGVRNVLVRSAGGAGVLKPGEPVQIVVELEANEPVRIRDLRVDLSIAHPAGDQYVALSTVLDGGERIASETILGSRALVCELDGLPLKPGTYIVGVVLRRHGEIVEQIDRAADLTVVTGPFFDSGGVPSSYPAAVLVRHSWSLGDVDAQSAGASRIDVASASPR
jgi:lipopolysaccharide transport system ATP-binding protein